MSILKQIQEPIENELKNFNKIFKQTLVADDRLVDIIIQFIIRRKGKQLRPILVFLSAGVCQNINESTYNAAAFIELMHTATLIHDDVVDESYMRRHFFSLNALWRNKISVLVGDYLLARGLLLSVKKQEYELLNVVSTAIDEMSVGEILQIRKSQQLDITEEVYFDIISKKTASLIGACTKAGAVSAKATDAEIEKMFRFGINLGIAFQIKDDLLDYSFENETGKLSGNDIKEKKLTLPLIFAKQNSKKEELNRILKIIKKKNRTTNDFLNLINIVKEKGGFDYAEQKMDEFKGKALACLESFPDTPYLHSLKTLAHFVTERNT